MSKENMKHRRLQELKLSDFDIVDGEPDIRGWEVKLGTGETIGEVEELIVDARNKKVRYMVVDLDNDKLGLEDREVLIPIGMAKLHEKDDDVLLPNITVQQVIGLPEYDSNRLDSDVESRICSVLGRTGHRPERTEEQRRLQTGSNTGSQAYLDDLEPEPDFYKHDYYNDDNLYGNRLHEMERRKKQESEFDKGLRLWEKRSQGGLIQDGSQGSTQRRPDTHTPNYRQERVEDESLMHVRNNRNTNNDLRSSDDDLRDDHSNRTGRRDNTIEGRIRDEGLQ